MILCYFIHDYRLFYISQSKNMYEIYFFPLDFNLIFLLWELFTFFPELFNFYELQEKNTNPNNKII